MAELLAPLKFLQIEHRRSKRYNFAYPAAGGAALALLLTSLPGRVAVFGDGGFLAQVQTFLSILGGFCIAALILLATDENKLLGEPFAGARPPKLKRETHSLTRRRFLAYLFGYLSFACFGLLAWATVAEIFAQGLAAQTPTFILFAGNLLFYFGFGAWITHILTISLLGLYYLTERLHQRPPDIIRTRGGKLPVASGPGQLSSSQMPQDGEAVK